MNNSPCDVCGGCGVLFDTGMKSSAIERCDECKTFSSDQDALNAVEKCFIAAYEKQLVRIKIL